MDLKAGSEQVAIVKTISTLATNLGMNVIAEGIEEVDQAEQLKALDCGFGQGFYFSKALSSRDMEKLLRSGHSWPIN